jgi:putative redox protein
VKNDKPGVAADIRADLRVGLTWVGDLRFDVGPAGRAPITLDGDSRKGHSPPEAVLDALVSCVSVDVVLILQKMRMPPSAVSCDVTAERRAEAPRRLTRVHLHYKIAGEGIVEERAMRAIELSVTKHCTVRETMDPEMPVTWSLELTGSARGSRELALGEVPE